MTRAVRRGLLWRTALLRFRLYRIGEWPGSTRTGRLELSRCLWSWRRLLQTKGDKLVANAQVPERQISSGRQRTHPVFVGGAVVSLPLGLVPAILATN
jgi:hypothetical protein